MFSQCGGQLRTRHPRFAHQQFDRWGTEHIGEGHLGVVRIEPRVFVAGCTDELRGGRVVCAAAHPFGGQTAAGHRPVRRLGEFRKHLHRQGPRRDHPIGGRVVDDRSVGAHRQWREPEFINDRSDPSRRSTSGEDELCSGRHGGHNRLPRARSDAVRPVEQSPVDVGRDQRRQHQGSCAARRARCIRVPARHGAPAAANQLHR